MANMILDATGVKFIKQEEGCPKNSAGLAVAYQDERGIWTIGYGHTLGVKQGDTMTVAQAEKLLPTDCSQSYGKCVNTYIKPTMTQNQFNAMTSLCYNIGVSNDPKFPGFPQSEVCKHFNRGDIKGASDAFRGWERPASLKGRREREIKLFNTAPTTAQKTATPAKTNNNTDAVKDAKKAQDAKDASAKLKAKQVADQVAKAKALKASEALKKAKLTKNADAIKKAQADVNAQKAKKVIKPLPKEKVVKGSMGFIGLFALLVVLRNGYDL